MYPGFNAQVSSEFIRISWRDNLLQAVCLANSNYSCFELTNLALRVIACDSYESQAVTHSYVAYDQKSCRSFSSLKVSN